MLSSRAVLPRRDRCHITYSVPVVSLEANASLGLRADAKGSGTRELQAHATYIVGHIVSACWQTSPEVSYHDCQHHLFYHCRIS